MGKTSLKLNMIIEHIKASGVNYTEMTDVALKKYLKKRYKCSDYLANQVFTKLLET